jgi:hypothetical protein
METLLAFAPFIVYVVIERIAGIMPGLVSAAAVSVVLLLRDIISPSRTVRILDIGTALLFGGLAAYARFTAATWSIVAVRLRVDAGLLLIVLASIIVCRPFTLQYARERVARELWDSPEFVRTNYVITAAWAGAFAVMVAADLVMLYVPTLPRWVGIAATVAALYGAFSFTDWYPPNEIKRKSERRVYEPKVDESPYQIT